MCRSHEETIVLVANGSSGEFRFRYWRRYYARQLVTEGLSVIPGRMMTYDELRPVVMDEVGEDSEGDARHSL